VLGQAVVMAATGVGIGVVLALVSAKTISAMLYGVGPRDPIVLGGVSIFLVLIALIAALAPAVRAARIDPVQAIRVD